MCAGGEGGGVGGDGGIGGCVWGGGVIFLCICLFLRDITCSKSDEAEEEERKSKSISSHPIFYILRSLLIVEGGELNGPKKNR